MNKLVAAIAVSLTGTLASTASADVTVLEREYTGKPPYQRSISTLPEVEIARMEAADMSLANTATVREREFTGRPPYRRNVEILPTVEMARFEIADQSGERRHRRGPFAGRSVNR